MNHKKEEERHQLIKFVSHKSLKLIVKGIEDSETPDFIVNINDKLVSIEHTRLINPTLKQIEAYKEKIIIKAHKRFEEKYSAKLYALITFKDIPLKLGKKEEEKYINEVFYLIEDIYLKNKKFEFNISSKTNKNASESIESFSVNNTQNFSHWQHFGAYLVEWIDMEWLQNNILKKEENMDKYRQKFDENWLLLVSNFGTKASGTRYDFIDYSAIKSKFDKIYIFSYRANEITVIK